MKTTAYPKRFINAGLLLKARGSGVEIDKRDISSANGIQLFDVKCI